MLEVQVRVEVTTLEVQMLEGQVKVEVTTPEVEVTTLEVQAKVEVIMEVMEVTTLEVQAKVEEITEVMEVTTPIMASIGTTIPDTMIQVTSEKFEPQLYSKSRTKWLKMRMILNLGPKSNMELKAMMKPVPMVLVSPDVTWNTGGSSSVFKTKILAYI